MSLEETYRRVRDLVERRKKETAQAEGALSQMKKNLKEYGFATLKEAAAEIKQLEKADAEESPALEKELKKLAEELNNEEST